MTHKACCNFLKKYRVHFYDSIIHHLSAFERICAFEMIDKAITDFLLHTQATRKVSEYKVGFDLSQVFY